MKETVKQTALLLCIALIGHFLAFKVTHIPRQLEVVVLFAGLLFYPVMRKPIIGVYAVFILSPFIPHIRRLYYLRYERPGMDPLIVLGEILLVFILLGLYNEFRSRKDLAGQGVPVSRIVFIYFVILVLRTFLFTYMPLPDAVAKFKYYGPPVLFFFIGGVFAREYGHLKKIWYLTIVIGVLASLYGLKQLYYGYSEAEKLWFSSIEFSTLFIKDVARPFSLFQAPVAFADYLQVAVIGILVVMIWNKAAVNAVLLALLPLFLYGSLITSVRSSWIGLLLTFPLWFLFFRVKGNAGRFGILAVLIAATFIYQYFTDTAEAGFSVESGFSLLTRAFSSDQNFNLLVTNRASALYNPLEEHSMLSRMALWRDLINYANEPILAILGRGLGALNADSLYFTYLAEFGYPGMAGIVLILVLLTGRALRVIDFSDDRTSVALAKGVAVMNIIFAIVSITGMHLHYFPGDVYFWFWNGVIAQLALQCGRPDAADGHGAHAIASPSAGETA